MGFPSRYLPGDMFSLCVLQEDRAHNTTVFLNIVQRHHEMLDPENPRDFIDVYLLRMMEDQKLNPDSSTFSCKNYRSFFFLMIVD